MFWTWKSVKNLAFIFAVSSTHTKKSKKKKKKLVASYMIKTLKEHLVEKWYWSMNSMVNSTVYFVIE